MNFRHLLRMTRWARRPPSMKRVILVAVVVAACLAIAGLEWLDLWPDDFGMRPGGERPRIRPLP